MLTWRDLAQDDFRGLKEDARALAAKLLAARGGESAALAAATAAREDAATAHALVWPPALFPPTLLYPIPTPVPHPAPVGCERPMLHQLSV